MLKFILSRLHILPAGCHHRLCQEPEAHDRICFLWVTGHFHREPMWGCLLPHTKTDRLQVPSSNPGIWNPSSVTISTRVSRQGVAWGYMTKSGLTRSSWEPEGPPHLFLLSSSGFPKLCLMFDCVCICFHQLLGEASQMTVMLAPVCKYSRVSFTVSGVGPLSWLGSQAESVFGQPSPQFLYYLYPAHSVSRTNCGSKVLWLG